MNTASLKKYAPAARRAFIAAVTARAAAFGLSAKGVTPMTEQGDLVLIGDKPFPRSVADIRRKLEQRIKKQGFAQVMEAMAYTWFNRLVAIRFMELHGYLDHGRRVLSHPDKLGGFEILDACTEVELPGLNRNQVLELKLEGNKDEELYRLLLLGQCRVLHQAMPFLFEAIEDETELLLPDNLTKTDSLIRRLVDDIPEEDWQQVEIVGWLYQFYISEKKDQVIGKVVKSEDIPAATQLFTPNWIVKYMVQNSLGAQWLATYPNSPLRQQMEYYIEPAEQTEEVQAQLKAITPTSLDPEHLTLMDPACGSGHILVEAYELFKAIYLERGYRQRDIPKLVLEKNLYGLEIDPRAAQLTGFALMMKGREDDRRLFERGITLNVMALVDSAGFDAEGLAKGVKLSDYGLKPGDLTELKRLFEHATTFGSLIQVSEELADKLPPLKQLSEATSQDLFVSNALRHVMLLVQQAELLITKYDAVAANPPYMGGKNMNPEVKNFAGGRYPDTKGDLFACFMERALSLVRENGHYSLITMPSWLFLSSFQKLREKLFATCTINSLLHMGRGIFGIDFGSTAFVVQKTKLPTFCGRYFRLHKRNFQHIHIPDIAQLLRNTLKNRFYRYDFDGYRDSASETAVSADSIANGDLIHFMGQQSEFDKIPGSPVAYWASPQTREVFGLGIQLGEVVPVRQGLATADNDRFIRYWPEVPLSKSGFAFTSRIEAAASDKKWFPYNKGGDFRKWFGNNEYLINWEDDGGELNAFKPRAVIRNPDFFFLPSVTWSFVSSTYFGVRHSDAGALFDVGGSSAFPSKQNHLWVVGLLCSKQVLGFMKIMNPTLNFQVGNVAALPVLQHQVQVRQSRIESVVNALIDLARRDWNAYERSWNFQTLPLLTASTDATATLESRYTAWITQNCDTIAEMKRLEEENNRLFIDAYGLADELTPDVPIEQITLTVNPAYRYGSKLTGDEQWTRFRQDTMQELVSYAVGCMMGRYSLDEPGLIYAHSGNEGFDPSRYSTFPADDDGIVPLTDTEWFDDDAAHRLIEFMSVAWDKRHLEANLTFLADNLSPKKNESSRETLRRYLCDSFFKDHLQTYKNRPIYWLFSSGKQKAFQCLVYLHRYNEGTLARMRTEYVIPLQGLMASRIERLDADILAASSTAHRKRLEKEKDKLVKQRAELQQFDEKLRHYADRRIKLDLDDGVKVNYGKFGDLLAEVKKITGE